MTKAMAVPTVPSFVGEEGPIARHADRVLLVGCLLVGTQVLGVIGLVVLVVGVLTLRRATAAGEQVRPLAVTVLGVFSLADAATNILGWGIDTFAHGTHVGQVFMTGFGQLVDGGYYIDYNTLLLGGASGAGEKSGRFSVFARSFLCASPLRGRS